MNKFRLIFLLLVLIFLFQPQIFGETQLSDKDKAKYGLAQSLMNMEKYKEAEENLQRLRKNYPDHKDINLNLAKSMGYSGDIEGAVQILDDLERKFPDAPEIKEAYANILEANQKFTEAGERYEGMFRETPENERLLMKAAEVNAWAGDYEGAKAKYLILIEKDPHDQEAALGLADVYFWSRDYEKAIPMYEKMDLSPEKEPQRYQNLGRAYLLTKMSDKALEIYNELDRLYPDDTKISVSKMSALYDVGETEAAEKEKEELFARSEDDVKVKIEIAEALALRSRYADAINVLEETLKIDPENKEAKLYLARVYSWDTQYGKSLAIYDELIEDFPTWTTPRREKGRVLGWSRKYRKAIAAYESIFTDIGPDNEARLEMNAKKDFYKGFDRRAIKEYKQWLDAEKDDPEALYDLGQVYSRQMQWNNAQRTYTKLLQIVPDHFRAKQALDKVDIYADSLRVETGYEYYEADSASRDMDEKYHKIQAGARYPVRKDLYVGIMEETFLYSSELFSQITRQVISVAMEYYFKPIFWVKGGYSFNHFTKGVGDNHNFSGEINFKPIDMITSTFSYDRENITDNGETIKRRLRRDNYRTRLEIAPNRRITAGADFKFSNYTNGNERAEYGFDVKTTLFYEPHRLQAFYRYEVYGFQRPSDFYFAPSSFHTSLAGLEWQQHLNSEELFWGINETYFTVRYSINFDVNNQVGHKLFVDLHRDWTDRISTHFEWSKMMYQEKDTYSEDRAFVYLKVDF